MNKHLIEPKANSKVRYITRRVVEKPQVTHRLSPIYLPPSNMQTFTNAEPCDTNEPEPVPCYIMPVMYLEQQVLDDQITPRQSFEIPQKTSYMSARRYEPYMDNYDDQNYYKPYSKYYLLPQPDNFQCSYEQQQKGPIENFEYYNKDYDSATSFNVGENYYSVNPKFEYGSNEAPVKEPPKYPPKKIVTESKRKTSRGSQTTLNEHNFYLYQTGSPIECRATQTFKEHGEKNLTSIATQTQTQTKSRLGLFGCGLTSVRNLDNSSNYNVPGEKTYKYRANLPNISENDTSKLQKSKKQTKQYSSANSNLTNKEPLSATSNHLNSQLRRKKE